MFTAQINNSSHICWEHDGLKFIAQMVIEHYKNILSNVVVIINCCDPGFIRFVKENYPKHKIILYNLEHKYPVKENGLPPHTITQWQDVHFECFRMVDEIWDYNIENYLYFKFHRFNNKFMFKPLRYTTWFEQYISNQEPRYELEFDGVFHSSRIRCDILQSLTSACSNIVGGNNWLKIKIANTTDMETKYLEKQDAKYNLDMPRLDESQTINHTRICESICLNKQVICLTPNKIGSYEYFKDLIIYDNNVNPFHIKELVDKEPRKDVAQIFKKWTYLDSDYENYKNNIVQDFERIENIKIPNTILYI